MIYLDSCALVKLVRAEDGSSALQAWLDERSDELVVTSELARAEVLRTVRRNNHRDTGELIDPAALADELAEAAEVLAAPCLCPDPRRRRPRFRLPGRCIGCRGSLRRPSTGR